MREALLRAFRAGVAAVDPYERVLQVWLGTVVDSYGFYLQFGLKMLSW